MFERYSDTERKILDEFKFSCIEPEFGFAYKSNSLHALIAAVMIGGDGLFYPWTIDGGVIDYWALSHDGTYWPQCGSWCPSNKLVLWAYYSISGQTDKAARFTEKDTPAPSVIRRILSNFTHEGRYLYGPRPIWGHRRRTRGRLVDKLRRAAHRKLKAAN